MELKQYIGKKILWTYTDHDKKLMGLPKDYTEIFVGETIQKEDNEFLLWDNQYRYVTLNYAKEYLIDTN